VVDDGSLQAQDVASPGGGPVALTQLPGTATRSGLFLQAGSDVCSSVALRCTELDAAHCLGISGLGSVYFLHGPGKHTMLFDFGKPERTGWHALLPTCAKRVV
jgi:hypothetical protein